MAQLSRAKDFQNLHEQNNDKGLHINLGFGASHFGPTFRAGAAFSSNKNIFSIRYLRADEFRFNVEGHYDEPARKMREYSILYGRFIRDDFVYFSASGGLGYITGTDRGEELAGQSYPSKELNTIGFSYEAKFYFMPTNFFGIGISAFGSINSQKSYAGGMIEIKIGK